MAKFTESELETMQNKLLDVQDKKQAFITVREAAQAMGINSPSSAVYRLDAMVAVGLAQRTVDGHYHIVEVE
jgi:predicted transcriptional regulator of viral defense system